MDSYEKETNFAKTLACIDEIRVACSDWDSPGREITIYVIVPSNLLPAADIKSPDWSWSADNVTGLNRSEQRTHLKPERISELILINFAKENESALVELWRIWQDSMEAQYLTRTDEHVASIELQVVSGSDFTYDLYVESEVLDFSTLSLLEKSD